MNYFLAFFCVVGSAWLGQKVADARYDRRYQWGAWFATQAFIMIPPCMLGAWLFWHYA